MCSENEKFHLNKSIMLQAKTKEQRDHVSHLIVDESPENNSVLRIFDDWLEADIGYLSFDTMAKIVDYLRKENDEVVIPKTCRLSVNSDGVFYDLRNTPHDEVMQFCKKLAWVNEETFDHYYEQYVKTGKIRL